jgi:hypothetical protein
MVLHENEKYRDLDTIAGIFLNFRMTSVVMIHIAQLSVLLFC